LGKLLLCIRIQQAVCKSSLDRDERHLLMVMAVLADWHTGVGTASQKTIADAMGCTDRYVRLLLSKLSKREDSPVMVTRRRRSSATGRTSDQYTLQFTQPESMATPSGTCVPEPSGTCVPEPSGTCVPEPSGTCVPDAEPLKLLPQPEIHDTPTGNPRHPNRNVRSDDQISSDLSQISSSVPRKVSRAKKSESKPSEKQPVEGANDLKLHYVAEFKRARADEPAFGKAWGRAVKAFGDMVTTHGLERAKRIVTGALDSPFGSKTPWAIRDNAVNYQGTAPVAARGRAPEPQRSHDQERTKSWGKSGALAEALAPDLAARRVAYPEEYPAE
jgi:hypothetical protein